MTAAVDRAARAVVLGALDRLDSGTVVVREPGRLPRRFGPGTADRFGRPALEAEVEVHDPRTYRAVLTASSTGLGDAWVQGWWDCDDLPAFLRLLARTAHRADWARHPAARAVGRVTDRVRALRPEDPERDRRNIAAHYDLGNDFFALMLDDTMTYSAGVFAAPDASLADASIEKLDRLCRLVELDADQRVVEIGTGWGSFAVRAAQCFGAQVTTTTLSAEQHDLARKRVASEGLTDRVDVRNDDYRELEGTFDKLVSIEMIEAVDWRELDSFFATCDGLLAPDGLMGLQAIVIPGQRWAARKNGRDFVKARIFPGGCLPSLESISRSLRRATDLQLVEVHDYGLHYAETLRRWRANIRAHRHQCLDDLGLDPAFLRLWDFYLCYCEAGFDEREISVVQCLLARPGYRPPAPFGGGPDWGR